MSSTAPFICSTMLLNNEVNRSHHSPYEDYSHVSHNLFSEETNRYANITNSYPNGWSDTVNLLGARINNVTPVNGLYGNITCAEIEQIEFIRNLCKIAKVEALRGQIANLPEKN